MASTALVTSNGSGPYTQTALAADLATGRAEWRFDPGAVTVLADGPPGSPWPPTPPPASSSTRAPASALAGRHRVVPGTVPLVTAATVVAVEGGVAAPGRAARQPRAGRHAGGGRTRSPPRPPAPAGAAPGGPGDRGSRALPTGQRPLLSYDLATGRPAWRADLPTSVTTPPVPAAGRLLIQPADPGYACALSGG